jgi:ATP-dependent DNA helicase RecG
MMNTLGIEENLSWFNKPVQYVKGIGPVLAGFLGKLAIHTLEDFLYHLPFRYLDRREISAILKVQPGKNRCVMGEVYASGEVSLGRKGRRAYEVILSDGQGYLTAKWFHYPRKFFQNRFQKGEKFIFFGEISVYRGQKQIVHPEVLSIREFFDEEELQKHLGIIPVYSSTEGLHQRQIRHSIQYVLQECPEYLVETLPALLLDQYRLPTLTEAFQHIHGPSPEDSIEELATHRSSYHRRLAFDEFFYLQLGLGIRREKFQKIVGFSHEHRTQLGQALAKRLPFELTQGQRRAIEEIYRDMCSSQPMNRLLQGDVGSGKTLVCLFSALLAIENNMQVAVMVPTEILAEQHFKNFKALLADLGVDVFLLTASTKGRERSEILSHIQKGKPAILVGTHALLEGDVNFDKLSLVIIDEQHRFGVRQRMKLMRKGQQPDILVMTATPIPRSLAMTLYGDLDLSLMPEMPRGRRPIVTRIMYEKNRPKLYEFVRDKIAEGRQAYFVFPLIEESEKLDLRDATRAYERLQEIFRGYTVAMLHGRMKNAEKEEIMRRFSLGEIQILVATTVVEVGIDVPNATIMVIEHAERFGLSQLHQLRGRVGRGSAKSYCVLATDYRQSDLARERLRVMEQSTDGFQIAEEDLKIRGPGDFLGTRQSGVPDFRVANLVTDLDLLEAARKAAAETLHQDPELCEETHRNMRRILEHRWKGRLGLAQVG